PKRETLEDSEPPAAVNVLLHYHRDRSDADHEVHGVAAERHEEPGVVSHAAGTVRTRVRDGLDAVGGHDQGLLQELVEVPPQLRVEGRRVWPVVTTALQSGGGPEHPRGC